MSASVKSTSVADFLKTQKTKILFVGVFVIIGCLFLFVTHAATPTASTEPENGTLNGATAVTDTNASGGKAIKFSSTSGIPTQTTSYLPINLPTQAWLKKGITSKSYDKLVFAHYFTAYPLRIANVAYANDWYAQRYVYPYPGGADPTTAAAYGGLLREAPLPQAVGASSWQLDDMKTEVTRATEAGLDGFTLDMLSFSTTSNHYARMKLLLQAAQAVDPNFKIMLMPDGSGINKNSVTYQTVADTIASLATNATYKNGLFWLPDGRLVVSPFGPELEANATTYWQNFISYMKSTYGITVAFVPCFVNYGNNVAAFSSMSYGLSEWGGRSPKVSNNIATNGNDAHARGKIWMQPVSYQDERADQNSYAEAQNGDNYRITWASANSSDADWVQIPTWNDYSEQADIAPSTHHGWNLLDITSYYLTQFKNGGTATPIVRDIAYVNFRTQQANATVTGQTKTQVIRSDSNAPRDLIEVDTFLTAPATVTLKVGSTTNTYTAPAGVSYQTYPIAAGAVSVTVVRNGTTVATITPPNSDYNITIGSVTIQDEHYRYLGSVSSRNDSSGY